MDSAVDSSDRGIRSHAVRPQSEEEAVVDRSRILLIGYENDGCTVVELARALMRQGCGVFVLFGDQHTLIKKRAWEERAEQYGISFETLARAFSERENRADGPDWAWIRRFEQDNLFNKSFNELLMTDPLLSQQHHHRRPYYTKRKEDDALTWAECIVRHVKELMERYRPDTLVTIERNYLVKNAAAQMAMSTNVRVLSYVPCRIGEYGVWIHDFGFSRDHADPFGPEKEAGERLRNQDAILRRVAGFVNGEKSGLYGARSTHKRQNRDGVGGVMRQYALGEWRAAKRLFAHARAYRKGRLRRWSTPLAGRYLRIRVFQALIVYRRLREMVRTVYDEVPRDRRFILFPLHVLPESSTLTLGPEYYEIDIVRRLSHAASAGMVILVKENPNMVGVRTRSERAALRDLPNIRYVSPWVDTKKLVHMSDGVAGISGTALLEAALLGKPALAVGSPEFRSCLSHTGMENAQAFLRACEEGGASAEGAVAAHAYVKRMAANAVYGTYAAINSEARNFPEAVDQPNSLLRPCFEALWDRLGGDVANLHEERTQATD